MAIWRTYLDEDVICSTWTANTTYPGYDRIGWHPDFPYQWLTQPWPSDRISVQTIDKARLSRFIGRLPPSKMRELCSALARATGCD